MQSINSKIITFIIISVLVFGIISSIVVIAVTESKVVAIENSFSSIITNSIGKTMVNQILFSDPSLVQGTLNSLVDHETVLFAYITDANNDILYHTFQPYIPEEIENLNLNVENIELNLKNYGEVYLRSDTIYYGIIGRVYLGVKKPNYNTLWFHIIIISITFFILIIIVLIRILSKNLTTPLISLIKSLDDRDTNGIPTNIIYIPKVQEFKILANTLNNMIEHIKESHCQLEKIYDNSLRTLIVITDQNDNIVLFNKGAQNILGYEKDSIKNIKKYSDLIIHKNTLKEIPQTSDEYREEEWVFRSFSGKEVIVDIIYTHLKDKEKNITGTIFFGQDVTYRKTQEQEILVINHELKLHKENLEYLVEARTRELQESLNKLEETKDKLVESEKLSSLGGLVAGVAHEINTPVGIGVTAASFLVEETVQFQKLLNESSITKKNMEEYLINTTETGQIILTNMINASNLVNSFKQVAVDRTDEKIRRFQLSEYIEEILLSINHETRQNNHEIIVNCDENIYLTSFPGIISQVFTNLIFNSFLHGFEGIDKGHISINITDDREYITIEFLDDGCGIAPDNISKIYDPFYTTKRGHGGTGLGLNIVYNLISSKLKGSIKCKSEVNKFTKFVITIPNITDDV